MPAHLRNEQLEREVLSLAILAQPRRRPDMLAGLLGLLEPGDFAGVAYPGGAQYAEVWRAIAARYQAKRWVDAVTINRAMRRKYPADVGWPWHHMVTIIDEPLRPTCLGCWRKAAETLRSLRQQRERWWALTLELAELMAEPEEAAEVVAGISEVAA